MKKINLIYIFVVMMTMLAAAPVYAETAKEGAATATTLTDVPKEKHGDMDKVMSEVGLNDEQKQAIKDFRKEQRERSEELRTKIQEKRKELRDELIKKDSDTVKIDQLKTDITGLFEEKMQQRIDGVLKIKEILTPEQYEKLNQKMKEKHEAWKEKRENKKEGMKGKMKEHHTRRKP